MTESPRITGQPRGSSWGGRPRCQRWTSGITPLPGAPNPSLPAQPGVGPRWRRCLAGGSRRRDGGDAGPMARARPHRGGGGGAQPERAARAPDRHFRREKGPRRRGWPRHCLSGAQAPSRLGTGSPRRCLMGSASDPCTPHPGVTPSRDIPPCPQPCHLQLPAVAGDHGEPRVPPRAKGSRLPVAPKRSAPRNTPPAVGIAPIPV